jgi:hypothetical protein
MPGDVQEARPETVSALPSCPSGFETLWVPSRLGAALHAVIASWYSSSHATKYRSLPCSGKITDMDGVPVGKKRGGKEVLNAFSTTKGRRPDHV